MGTKLTLAGKEYTIDLLPHGGGARIWIDSKSYEARLATAKDGRQEILIDDIAYPVHAVSHGSTSYIHAFGRTWEVEIPDAVFGAAQGKNGFEIFAPMPGTVIDLKASIGQSVRRGQTLLVIESMKMQTEITANMDGILAEVLVLAGQVFNRGDLLARLKKEEK